METNGVQIINDNNNHCLCISTTHIVPNSICIYNSCKSRMSKHLSFLATLCKIKENLNHCDWNHKIRKVQSIVDLFAIAAAALCHRVTLYKYLWNLSLMQPYLMYGMLRKMEKGLVFKQMKYCTQVEHLSFCFCACSLYASKYSFF